MQQILHTHQQNIRTHTQAHIYTNSHTWRDPHTNVAFKMQKYRL